MTSPISTSTQEIGQNLFKKILSQQQITELSTVTNRKQFLALCSAVGTLFYRKVCKKPNQVLAFLANYHQIIMNIKIDDPNQQQNNLKINASFVNNISLHFILLASYNSLETGNQSQAKQILKNSIKYIDSVNPDPILLATCLSNYSLILLKRNKFYKPLPYLLKTVQILETYIKQIKKSDQTQEEKRYEILEMMIFLVNGYINLSHCLEKIIYKNNKYYYRNMLQEVNKIALRKSLKYLGKSSYFTIKLINQIQAQTSKNVYHIDIPLPVYKIQTQPQIESEQEIQEDRDKKIMQQFQKLYVLIKQIQEKQVVQVIQKQEPPKPPPKQIPNAEQLVCRLSFKINDWDVEVQVLKDKKKQRLGTTVLQCTKGADRINTMISQKKMLSIVSQMNLYDIIPYENSFWSLTVQEYIQYCVIGFLSISDNKNIELYPRAIGFTNPLKIQFLTKSTYIFINHIRGLNYRLSICPLLDVKTFHLDVQFQQSFIQQLVQVYEEVNQNIIKLYQNLIKHGVSRKEVSVSKLKSSLLGQPKQVMVKDDNKLIKTIQKILNLFELFLTEKKNTEQIQIFKQEHQFYKFKQSSKIGVQGTFYFIRYSQQTDSLDVYAQNTFNTYGIQGKYRSKGNTSISISQVASSVGFIEGNLRIMIKQTPFVPFKMIAQIFSQRFYLKYYQNPLTATDLETFQENSMMQLKFSCKTFLRKMVKYNNYFHPLTITLININNQFPIGLKISIYDQIICQQASYFIHIYPEIWKWPIQTTTAKNQYQDILYHVIEQYSYKKNYFLVQWLERIGYRKIFQMIKVSQDGDLQIPALRTTFDSISSVVSKFST